MTPDEINTTKALVNQYGMPTIAACGMGYFIYFVWQFVTENINSKLNEARTTMINLIDRIGMLDNDMIRLEQKILTSMELKRGKSYKSINDDILSDAINKHRRVALDKKNNEETAKEDKLEKTKKAKIKNKSSRKQYR